MRSTKPSVSVLNWMFACWLTGTALSVAVLALLLQIQTQTGIAARRRKIGVDVPVYGVPVNTREALGVLHFKGFIIDDSVLYSGASLNDVYLHQLDKYRYDRYHLIRNSQMADIMFNWVDKHLVHGRGVNRLDDPHRPKSPEIKNDVRAFRRSYAMRFIISRRCKQRRAVRYTSGGLRQIQPAEQNDFPSDAVRRAEAHYLYAVL